MSIHPLSSACISRAPSRTAPLGGLRACISIAASACLAAAAAASLIGCLAGNQVAGGSEVTNGKTVAGTALDSSGAPVMQARIWIRPADYVRDVADAGGETPLADAVTDAAGKYSLANLAEGDYVVEIQGGRGFAAARRVVAHATFSQLPPDTLRKVGILEGRLEGWETSTLRSYVQVPGLERVVEADSQGRFSIPDLPAGIFSVVAVSNSPDLGYRKPAPAVITPGDTVNAGVLSLTDFGKEDYSQWPFSRTLRLPVPAAVGGNGNDTISDFPLLVRLDSSHFDFSLSNGGDLRFSGPDGRHLAYQVERWDAASRRAEIWVRLDTAVAGAAYDLKMHWGRLDAPAFSQGSAVFSGFAGAWHLGDALGAGGKAMMRDASPGGFDLQGTLAIGDRLGGVGQGALFQGADSLTVPGTAALRPVADMTVSAWFQATGSGKSGGEIVSMGNNYAIRLTDTGEIQYFVFDDPAWTSPGAPNTKWKRVQAGGLKLIDKQWHQVAAVLRGDSLSLHLDGKWLASAYFPAKPAYVFGKDFHIGNHGYGDKTFDFVGRIDEVQVSGFARSRAWIALAYQTQKAGSTLLEWK